MKKMKKLTIFGVALLAIAIVAPAANADTVSYNDTFGPKTVPFVPEALANLPLFNPANFGGAALTKVTLTLDADTFAGAITWDNESGVVTDVTLGIGAKVTAASSVGSLLAVTATPLQLGSATGVPIDDDLPPRPPLHPVRRSRLLHSFRRHGQ